MKPLLDLKGRLIADLEIKNDVRGRCYLNGTFEVLTDTYSPAGRYRLRVFHPLSSYLTPYWNLGSLLHVRCHKSDPRAVDSVYIVKDVEMPVALTLGDLETCRVTMENWTVADILTEAIQEQVEYPHFGGTYVAEEPDYFDNDN